LDSASENLRFHFAVAVVGTLYQVSWIARMYDVLE